jgi:hypothetical protein
VEILVLFIGKYQNNAENDDKKDGKKELSRAEHNFILVQNYFKITNYEK